jgi:hypothetical protein
MENRTGFSPSGFKSLLGRLHHFEIALVFVCFDIECMARRESRWPQRLVKRFVNYKNSKKVQVSQRDIPTKKAAGFREPCGSYW